jgi:dihydropyrimidinase
MTTLDLVIRGGQLATASTTMQADIGICDRCNSIKIFTAFSGLDAQVCGFVEAIRRVGMSGLISLIHCEDDALIANATAQLTAFGYTSLRYFAASRPIIAEVAATQRAVAVAEGTGAPVYVE